MLMDGAPLLLAQSHARKASRAKTPTAAVEEHELAAGQFASAAQSTKSSEAFRTLKLLEEHHARLSQLIKTQTASTTARGPEQILEKTVPIDQNVSITTSTPASPYRPETKSFPAAHRPSRDVGSSIASNLASARGIPSSKQRRIAAVSSPALAQQHAEGKILNPQRRSDPAGTSIKEVAEKSTISEKAANTQREDQGGKAEQSSAITTPKTDEGFNRFYNTFESLFSKLSAPLAFAGLPLNPDAETPAAEERSQKLNTPNHPRAKPKPTRPSSRATVEPEYSRLFSPAALAAVREEPGNSNLGAAESFLVVPSSYASMAARHQIQAKASRNHKRTLSRDSTGLSEDIDEFVDARETPGPPSPQASRRAGGSGRNSGTTASGAGGKSMEELHLENETLHGILDEMSRRLWQFECGAQMGSVALHQSIRASLSKTAASSSSADPTGDGARGLENRVASLEGDLLRTKKELERSGRENEKLKGVVGRYRERWEKLKEGARTRRGTGGSKDASGAGDLVSEAGET